ncbi:hypothetical protein J1C54_09620 [Alcanivorax sp. 1008]|nr:hypothetical protein [Alcanivorax sp. 1008]
MEFCDVGNFIFAFIALHKSLIESQLDVNRYSDLEVLVGKKYELSDAMKMVFPGKEFGSLNEKRNAMLRASDSGIWPLDYGALYSEVMLPFSQSNEIDAALLEYEAVYKERIQQMTNVEFSVRSGKLMEFRAPNEQSCSYSTLICYVIESHIFFLARQAFSTARVDRRRADYRNIRTLVFPSFPERKRIYDFKSSGNRSVALRRFCL